MGTHGLPIFKWVTHGRLMQRSVSKEKKNDRNFQPEKKLIGRKIVMRSMGIPVFVRLRRTYHKISLVFILLFCWGFLVSFWDGEYANFLVNLEGMIGGKFCQVFSDGICQGCPTYVGH
jgi:hypothetical protein